MAACIDTLLIFGTTKVLCSSKASNAILKIYNNENNNTLTSSEHDDEWRSHV